MAIQHKTQIHKEDIYAEIVHQKEMGVLEHALYKKFPEEKAFITFIYGAENLLQERAQEHVPSSHFYHRLNTSLLKKENVSGYRHSIVSPFVKRFGLIVTPALSLILLILFVNKEAAPSVDTFALQTEMTSSQVYTPNQDIQAQASMSRSMQIAPTVSISTKKVARNAVQVARVQTILQEVQKTSADPIVYTAALVEAASTTQAIDMSLNTLTQ